jgi:hypothetical protein
MEGRTRSWARAMPPIPNNATIDATEIKGLNMRQLHQN